MRQKKTSSKKSNSTVSLIEADGVLHTEKSAIARVLNVHFSLIGDKLAMKIEEKLKSAVNKSKTFFSPTYSHSFGKENLFTFSAITESFGLKQLKALRTNKATGLDCLSARLLTDSAQCMAPIMTKLFNRSLEASTFPLIWKIGGVCLIQDGRKDGL